MMVQKKRKIILPLILSVFFYAPFCVMAREVSEGLKVQIYGYPEHSTKVRSLEQFNPLQTENLSLRTPGLTMAKLGSLGQKTSLRFNTFTSGDFTFLFDGFEISDPSDPSEGFELSSFLMAPQFNFNFSNSENLGLFSRQAGGLLAIDPALNTKSYIHTGGGSEGQGLMALQKNKCSLNECYSLGLGGTFADGISASSNPSVGSESLSSDQAVLGFLSVSWHRQLSAGQMLKLRAHSQISQVDIDDYDENFIFRDDPNARLETLNHFLGISYLDEKNQYYFENTFSDRNVNNPPDASSSLSRDERYKVFRAKLRGSHILSHRPKSAFSDLQFYWYGQNIQLETRQAGNSFPEPNLKNLSRLEVGLQLDQKINLSSSTSGRTSISVNALEGFDSSYGISQNLDKTLYKQKEQSLNLQTAFGLNERRPSLFQLFDPQFGRSSLTNEELFYVRPKLKWVFKGQSEKKHNISLDYFWENINSRVVFLTDPDSELNGYQNSGRLNSNSLIFDYVLERMTGSSRFFFRQSLDSENTLKSFPWLARQEWGVGQSLRTQLMRRTLEFSVDIKWLLGMYNPSQTQIGRLVQSQGTVSYQYETNNRLSLQLNNLFNDKRIWDEGFQRQPFSWMLSFTKTI